MQQTKLKKGTKEELISRTYRLTYDWKQDIQEYLIFPKPNTEKDFWKQKHQEKITEQELKRRLKELR